MSAVFGNLINRKIAPLELEKYFRTNFNGSSIILNHETVCLSVSVWSVAEDKLTTKDIHSIKSFTV